MSSQTIHDSGDGTWISDWTDGPGSGPTWPAVGPVSIVRRGGGVFSPRCWAELLYAVIDLAPAITFFVLTITLLAVGAGVAVVYIGLPLMALGLLIARAGGHLQRMLAGVLLGLPVSGPGPIRRRKPGPIAALIGVLTDPGGWRAVTYHCLKILLAPVTFAVAVGFYSAGLGGVSYWFWQQYLPYQSATDGSRHRGMQWGPDHFVDTWPRMLLLAGLGLLVLALAPVVVRFFITIDRVLIAALLGGSGAVGRATPPPGEVAVQSGGV